MNWYEVKILTSHEAVEMIASILTEAGSAGVSIVDPLDLIEQEDRFGVIKPEVDELYSEDVEVSGYFPDTKNIVEIKAVIEAKLAQAKDFGLDMGKNVLVQSSVSEEDWANAWKTYYKPIRLSRFLTVVPSWETYEASDKELVIELDPGMAFGTGSHPTTRLALEALEQLLRGGEYVIDVGTGSGVLAIAAKLLGASRVEAYDLDEKATSVAKENIALNPIASDIIVGENDLLVGMKVQADLIVANILAEILERLVDDAWANLKPGGHLILSGVIQSKKEDLIAKLEAAGFDIQQVNQMKDWVSLIVQKPLEDEEN